MHMSDQKFHISLLILIRKFYYIVYIIIIKIISCDESIFEVLIHLKQDISF